MLAYTTNSRLVASSIGLTLALWLTVTGEVRAEVATEEQMQRVCRNWLAYMVYRSGSWAGDAEPEILGVSEILSDSGDMVMARCFSIAPDGHVVVPILMELPPIKAYSEPYGLDVNQTVGFPQLLREVLQHRLKLYIETYGSLEAAQPPDGEVLFDRVNREEWDRFLMDQAGFQAYLRKGTFPIRTEVGPLLTTAWYQREPYNNFCPTGDGGRCLVGCVATATAQIMNYHRWPPIGAGSHTYYWDGDNSCDPNHADGAGWLQADFSDAYDWANMPDDCDGGCSQGQQDALAELCYEVGVGFEMDYGVCGSGTSTDKALEVLPTYFRYDSAIDREDRDDGYTAETWFDLIKVEINAARPVLYRIKTGPNSGHAIVCDGWRDTGGQNQYHINYGWGGPHTEWFALDNIYRTYDPMQEYLIRNIEPPSGSIVAWGHNDYAQCDVPEPNTDFVAVAAGYPHSLGLKANGSVVAWGSNHDGQCDVPEPNADFASVAAAMFHSLGLKASGSVVAWGRNNCGQCDVPEPNTDFVAIAGGYQHSLGLKAEGSIVAWGYNAFGQCDVPEPNTGFVAVAAGYVHSLGLRADGSIVAWGYNNRGQCDVPEPNTDFVAVAGGYLHSLGLKADGSIVAWGYNNHGQCDAPEPNTDFVAVAGGGFHSLGLKVDGSIVAWGYNNHGQCDVPEPNTDFVAVAGGYFHSLGLKVEPDGEVPPGDLNADGCVDQADLGVLLADWGCTGGDCPGDCDNDGDADHADLGLLLAHWGEGCP
jgi:hypothetical protein